MTLRRECPSRIWKPDLLGRMPSYMLPPYLIVLVCLGPLAILLSTSSIDIEWVQGVRASVGRGL